MVLLVFTDLRRIPDALNQSTIGRGDFTTWPVSAETKVPSWILIMSCLGEASLEARI